MYFEGLSHGLTKLPLEPGKGEAMVAEGARLQELGNKLVLEAQAVLDNTEVSRRRRSCIGRCLA
jgi:hypothetical protein